MHSSGTDVGVGVGVAVVVEVVVDVGVEGVDVVVVGVEVVVVVDVGVADVDVVGVVVDVGVASASASAGFVVKLAELRPALPLRAPLRRRQRPSDRPVEVPVMLLMCTPQAPASMALTRRFSMARSSSMSKEMRHRWRRCWASEPLSGVGSGPKIDPMRCL